MVLKNGDGFSLSSRLSNRVCGSLELKESYSKAYLPTVMMKLNITTILTYFVQTKADFKATREESFELFEAMHVHVSKNRPMLQ